MNKTELIEKVAKNADLAKVDAKKAVEVALDAFKDALVKGDKIQLQVSTQLQSRRSTSLQRRLLNSRQVLNSMLK